MTETEREENKNIREHLIALTRDLILIPSTASRIDDIDRCFAFIKNYISTLDNISIKEYRHNQIPSLLSLPINIEIPEVLLVAHLDVICHENVEVYNPVIADGRIYGAGSGDMKGALAIMLDLFFNFHRSHPGISLGIAITSDEEQGGTSGIGYLFNEVGLRCGTAIVPDGGSLNEITIAEKGVIHLHIVCRGHSSHAARPWLGDNAIEQLLDRFSSLKDYFLTLKKSEDNWHSTCSLTILGTPNKATNRIPAKAEADLDIRFTPPHTIDKILAETKQVLGKDIETQVILSAEPQEFEPDPLFETVIEEVTEQPAAFVREDGASDSRFIQQYGIPVIISRPIVGELHSEDEWIDIDSMVKFYRICELYIKRKLLA